MSRTTPWALALAASAFAALLVATALPPVDASPGEPSPSPTPKDDLTKALDIVKAILPEEHDKLLVVKVDDPRLEAVRHAAIAVVKDGEVKPVDRLIDKLDDKFQNIFVDHAVHLAFREALVTVPTGSKGEERLEHRLKTEKHWTIQAALAWVLRKRPPGEKADALLRSLARSAPKPAVQGACIRALGARRCAAAVEELIEIMAAHEAEKDRLWLDARMALHEITGFDRGTAKNWRALWQEKGHHFDVVRDRGTEPAWSLSLPDGTPGEHIVPGAKVVVCIDTSGSLHIRDPREGDKPPADPMKRCPDCGRFHGPGTADAPPDRMRLERAKVVANEILTGLRPRSKFQLVRFDTTARSLNVRGLLLEASLHNLESAHDWLYPVEPNGVTKMVRGIEESFACEDMEVMYLITDGAPTGDVPNTVDAAIVDEVVAVTRELNRFRGVRIYPIGFKQVKAPLLELLALENNGSVLYVD